MKHIFLLCRKNLQRFVESDRLKAVTLPPDGRLLRIAGAIETAMKAGSGPGDNVWNHVSLWAEMNIFIAPNRAGWLDAVRYFSSMSLRVMQAWSHWENVDKEWRAAAPARFPNYAYWQCEVAAVETFLHFHRAQAFIRIDRPGQRYGTGAALRRKARE